MSAQTPLLFLLGAGSLFTLWWYGRFLSAYSNGSGQKISVSSFKTSDALIAAFLTIWFLYSAVQGFQHSSEVNLQIIIAGTAIYSAAILLLIGFQIFVDVNPIALYGLKIFKPLQALGCLLALLPLIYFLQIISGYFLKKYVIPQGIVTFITHHHEPRTLIIIGISIVIIAPIAEELIFRGFLYGVFSRYLGRWPGLLVSAFIFAAIHAHLPAFLPLFILAVFLTFAYERSGSLWTPILMHSGFNALNFAMILCFPELAQ
ncbi:MAG: type II CAAX endopeptidase family protein [Chthoniobacterales bacterium]